MSEWKNKYNAFNSLKALVHVEYWKPIVNEKIIPFPRFVSIDPCSVCNFKCPHCNANEALSQFNNKMDQVLMDKIVKLLSKWNIRAICIGGGGESLLNPLSFNLIDILSQIGIDVGVVTNGSNLINQEILLKCKWIGVSVDAATSKTYQIMKGIDGKLFHKVIYDMSKLTGKGTEISYKYLLHPNNCHEVYESIRIAKDIGCNLIHIRPGAEPWFTNESSWNFNEKQIQQVQENIQKGRDDFEDDKFKVYGITHKFNSNWSIKKSFEKCWACFVTCYIDARGIIGLCCDRRGDKKIELCHIDEIDTYWGSDKHRAIHDKIEVEKCPRCTYSHINEIFENVIINDIMMYNMY